MKTRLENLSPYFKLSWELKIIRFQALKENLKNCVHVMTFHPHINWVPVSYTHLTLPTICSV